MGRYWLESSRDRTMLEESGRQVWTDEENNQVGCYCTRTIYIAVESMRLLHSRPNVRRCGTYPFPALGGGGGSTPA